MNNLDTQRDDLVLRGREYCCAGALNEGQDGGFIEIPVLVNGEQWVGILKASIVESVAGRCEDMMILNDE